jgi:hypothetical protein
VKCDDIVNLTQCINDVFILIEEKCILIESEEPICRDVVKGCENDKINSKISCETYGAVVDDSDAPLECIWLEGNMELTIPGRCEFKVLYLYLYIYLYHISFFLICY